MNWLTALLCSLGLASCNTPPGTVTVTDPMSYLAGTQGDRKQLASDPILLRRYDYGRYQATDAFLLDDKHAVVTWDYPQFGQYAAQEGDGGEQYVLEGNTVRIEGTRDGGRPYNQYFVGKNCPGGGTGWVVFRTDADASWRQLTALLSDVGDPRACPIQYSKALTRYTKRNVTFPMLGEREAIISEHYNGSSVVGSVAMERSFYVAGWGRVVWQSFSVQPPSGDAQVAARCPDFGWNTAGNLPLRDCRESVISETVGGSFTGADMWSLGE